MILFFASLGNLNENIDRWFTAEEENGYNFIFEGEFWLVSNHMG
jgi:hypothetical protein